MRGFTLIELAIVIVVIGLIVGGVLVGRDLIEAASIRAEVSQLQKYQTAITTFRTKYGYLPGDVPVSVASQFGFSARSATFTEGYGDGNGQINAGGSNGCCNQAMGELVLLWVDLSTAGLIEGNFNTALCCSRPGTDIPATGVANYLPAAKLGQGNFVYAWASGTWISGSVFSGITYLGIARITSISSGTNYGGPVSEKNLSVYQAAQIDSKIDDGLPDNGKIISIYVNGQTSYWSSGTDSKPTFQAPIPEAISPSATTCYDNNGNSMEIKKYTMTVNNGRGTNCGLSYRLTL